MRQRKRNTRAPTLWEIDEAHERNYGRPLALVSDEIIAYDYEETLRRRARRRPREDPPTFGSTVRVEPPWDAGWPPQ